MSSESEKILQMVAEGTITVEEAQSLLECLGVVEQQTETQTGASHMSEKTNADAEQVSQQASHVGPSSQMIRKSQYAYDVERIKALNISWISGEIELRVYDGAEINITEYSKYPLAESDKMDISEQDGQLMIKWDRRSNGIFSLSSITALISKSTQAKQLVIEIPQVIANRLERIECSGVSSRIHVVGVSGGQFTCSTISGALNVQEMQAEYLKLTSISGKVSASAITANNIVAKSTSGSITLENIHADSLWFEGISGAVNLYGKFGFVKGTTISGALQADFLVCPNEFSADTVSGKIRLYLPENDGIHVDFNSMSGKFQSDFPLSIKYASKASGTAGFGSGKYRFRLKTVSGSMQISRKE